MNSSLKKKLMNLGWLALTAAGVVLLAAGVQSKNNAKCKAVKVEVSGVNKHIFLDEKEVENILNANQELVGMPIKEIDLQLLEHRLEKDHWIYNAELFFDKSHVLQVEVEEREPVARIFTTGGNSYYIDSTGSRLPLSDKVTVRVPMFTGFPGGAKRLNKKDSILMASVKDLANIIQNDSFWNAQVSQIDITADRTFEMIPTIGNHVVKLGKGEDVDQKLARLYSFYKQVWTRIGMERYGVIDVQYKGQVVATRKGVGGVDVDSAKAREALSNLISRNKPDTIEAEVKPAAVKLANGNVSSNDDTRVEEKTRSVSESRKQGSVKNNQAKQDEVKRQKEADRPKAVMEKKVKK